MRSLKPLVLKCNQPVLIHPLGISTPSFAPHHPPRQSSSALSSSLDIAVRTLPGDHVRPMQQALVDLPPELARAANQAVAQGGSILGETHRTRFALPDLRPQMPPLKSAARTHMMTCISQPTQVAWRAWPSRPACSRRPSRWRIYPRGSPPWQRCWEGR